MPGFWPVPVPVLAYPVIGMVCVGLSAAIYTTIHDLSTNPDVRLTKAHRADEMGELPVNVERAKGYVDGHRWSSVFAKIGGTYNTSASSKFVSYNRG